MTIDPLQPLLAQNEPIRVVNKCRNPDPPPTLIRAQPNQPQATALRISGYVQAHNVTGVRGLDLMVVTDLEYMRTPIFSDTVIFPETGSYLWQHVERLIRPRLPVQKIEMRFIAHCKGEVGFKDFKVEPIPMWDENPQLVIALLGDSTDLVAYLPTEWGVAATLQLLLRDRFDESDIQVRNLAESGDYLRALLADGRLERELATLPRCDMAVIRYGVNDANETIPPADFGEQITETARRVLTRFPGATIAIATPLPRGRDEHQRTLQEQYEAVVKATAAQNRWLLINLAEHIRTVSAAGMWDWHWTPNHRIGLSLRPLLSGIPDGLTGDLHPNAFGCRLIAEKLYQALEPAVAAFLHNGKDK
jgi:lysophospholipase L1-like esterase